MLDGLSVKATRDFGQQKSTAMVGPLSFRPELQASSGPHEHSVPTAGRASQQPTSAFLISSGISGTNWRIL